MQFLVKIDTFQRKSIKNEILVRMIHDNVLQRCLVTLAVLEAFFKVMVIGLYLPIIFIM